MFDYAHIRARIFGTPLLVDPRKLEALVRGLGPRLLSLEEGDAMEISAASPVAAVPIPARARDERKPYAVVDGVAVIDVLDSLVHRGSWLSGSSGLTSYQSLSAKLRQAMSDDEARVILLQVDSPGGEVAGAFDFSDEIYAARKRKPVMAVVDELAASAGYLVACAADEIIATRTAQLGSIGVVVTHADYSEAEKKAGIRITHIHAGARKVDFSPHHPLSDEAKALMQERVDLIGDLFASTVARNRGISAAAVKATEAGIFDAEKAVALKLADRIETSAAALDRARSKAARVFAVPAVAMVASANPSQPGGNSQKEIQPMADPKNPPAGGEVIDLEAIKAENQKLRADLEKANATASLANASLAEVAKKAKLDVIGKHEARGAIVPAMRPSVDKLADLMTAEELDKHLASFPVALNTAAKVDADPAKPEVGASLTADQKEFAEACGNVEAAEKLGNVVTISRARKQATLANGTKVPLSKLTQAVVLVAILLGFGASASVAEAAIAPLPVLGSDELSAPVVPDAVGDLDEISPVVTLAELDDAPTLVKQRDGATLRESEAPRSSIRGILAMLAALLGGAPLFGAALSAARQTPIVGPYKSKSLGVKTGVTIYKGGWVAIDATGYAIPASDTAGLLCVGIAMETVTNAGASGSKEIEIACDCFARVSAASIAVTNNGALMYIVDDQTVDEATGVNSIKAGVLDRFVSATEGIVYVPPVAAGRVI